MRKLTVYLFGAFVLWSTYHGYFLQHNIYSTEQACEAKAKIAADEWYVYWKVTRDNRWDADSKQEEYYKAMHVPLMNGTYSCWPPGRDLNEDPPPDRVRPWPTLPRGK